MHRSNQEAVFDLVVVLAAGIAHTSIMLGIGVELIPTLLIGIGLIGVGVIMTVPRNARLPAIVTGVLGMVLAGAVVPIYAARAVRSGASLWASLLLAGIVLLATFTLFRVTVFDPQKKQLV